MCHQIRRSAMVLLAVATLALVGGCSGGAAHPTAHQAPENVNSPDTTLVAMIACFRSHGLASFPDPVFDPNDGRWHLANQRPDITPQVQRACASVIPHASPAPAIPSAQLRDLLNYAKCVRAHGVPEFPDPGADGVFRGLGTTMKTDPRIRSASGACERYLASSGGSIQTGD